MIEVATTADPKAPKKELVYASSSLMNLLVEARNITTIELRITDFITPPRAPMPNILAVVASPLTCAPVAAAAAPAAAFTPKSSAKNAR